MQLESIWSVGRFIDSAAGTMEHLVRDGDGYAWSATGRHRFEDRAEAEAALEAVGSPRGAQAYPSRVGRLSA